MGGPFVILDPEHTGYRSWLHGRAGTGQADRRCGRRLTQNKRCLPAADKFDIHLGQEFGIQQRAVQRAMAGIDLEAPAQGIERSRAAGGQSRCRDADDDP